jgi:hypothetical protein
MKEKNAHTLRDSLQKLPQYAPPASVWEQLEHGLRIDALSSQEKNRNTLLHSLATLPQYDAPSGLWAALEKDLEDAGLHDGKEANRATLRRALENLPQYTPPYQSWENIADALDAEDMLSADVKKLPQYAPPAKVWEAIEQNLEVAQPWSVKRGRLIRALSAAAAVTGILIGAWWVGTGRAAQASEGEHIVVTQQKLDQGIVATVHEEDPAFQMVQTLCQERLPVCEKPEFKALRSELDELTQAKQGLRTALGSYGDDANLSAQLVKIEQERSAVLRQMIQLI